MTDFGAVLSGDPWAALRLAVGDPLHPGGYEATEALLDRAGVDSDTTLLDIGCGSGGALERARERGATAAGLDRNPGDDAGAVNADLGHVPVRTGSVDVVLGECVLCLAGDFEGALAETRRVLGPDGRLAFSDVTVDGDPPAMPDRFANMLCLNGRRDRAELVDTIEAAGYAVRDVRDHHEDLLAMRDRAFDRVDVDRLARLLGDEGTRLQEGASDFEAAIEDGTIGYVSLVADVVSPSAPT
jgi:arsenite methyltransferase